MPAQPSGNPISRGSACFAVGEHNLQLAEHHVPILAPGVPMLDDPLGCQIQHPPQRKVFDMYGGKAYDVRIRFRNELADAVIDQFGKDIQMFAVDAEHFTITAPIEVSPTFFAWIATFGRRVKILSPEPVVEKMRDFLQRSLDMYENDGEK